MVTLDIKIPGYRLGKQIGEGGMAQVFLGTQDKSQQQVAVKVMALELMKMDGIKERFERESKILQRMKHPNIIKVSDRGTTSGGVPYFVMEYIEGHDLSELIGTGGIDYRQKIDISVQICKALAYTHQNGVIHRDVKPANFLVNAGGHARMLDFGIAHFQDDTAIYKTQMGDVMGTYGFMAPEQQSAVKEVTQQSDIFSLGAIMYQLFTGEMPIGRFRAPRVVDEQIPKLLSRLIEDCLEFDPKKRPQSADVVHNELLRVIRGMHLKTQIKEKAAHGIRSIAKKFEILDVLREDKFGGVYLVIKKENEQMMILKKCDGQTKGLAEAQRMIAIKHPNIVEIYGASGNSRLYIVVSEYVRGGTLHDRLAISFSQVKFLGIAVEICTGLDFAHNHGVVHDNIRPSNVLFTESGHTKLSDFGQHEHYSDEVDQGNWYAIHGEESSAAKDIFSLGVVFYEMLIGVHPSWQGSELIFHGKFIDLDLDLQSLLTSMLELEPASRPNNLDEVLRRLKSILGQLTKAPSKTIIAKKLLDKPKKSSALIVIIFGSLFTLTSLVSYITLSSRWTELWFTLNKLVFLGG